MKKTNDKNESVSTQKAIKTFAYTIGGTLLPLVIAFFALPLFDKTSEFLKFFDKGDFLIFSAGLYTTAWLLYSESAAFIKEKKDKILSNLSILNLIICSAIYAIIYSFNLAHNEKYVVNLVFLRIASLSLFVISVFAVWRSIYINKLYTETDARASSNTEVQDIIDQL